MKLAIVVPGGFDRSGRERVIPVLLWLVRRLARHNEVHVFVTSGEGEPARFNLAGAVVHELGQIGRGPPGLRIGRLWTRLMRAIGWASRSGGFELIHGFWAGTSGALAGLAGRMLGLPVVLSIGGGELVWLPEIGYGGQGSWRSRLLVRLALGTAHSVTGGSRFVLQSLAGRARCYMVPLGVETAQFIATAVRPAGPPWRLIHVASINRVKDQATLLDALALVVAREPSLRLDWVGEDTLGGLLQRRCAELGLERHVTFHGFLPNDALVPLYHGAHLHVLSSRHESQAVVVGEAGAAGLPTVGTAVGVLTELAPAAAWAAPVRDAGELARGVLTLLGNQALRERMGRAAQAWSRRHDADWTAVQFERIYTEVLEMI